MPRSTKLDAHGIVRHVIIRKIEREKITFIITNRKLFKPSITTGKYSNRGDDDNDS